MAIDFDKVETVFEHNITEEEIQSIFYFPTTRNEFVSMINQMYDNDKDKLDSINANLYNLFRLRKNKQKALEYFNKISDCDAKWFSLANHCLI